MNSTNTIHFYKYQGAGNDFILIDNRLKSVSLDSNTISSLCDRRFGIGADGLILLENAFDSDFTMIYYNADGNLGSMCGNGGRCIVSFAKKIGLINDHCFFSASDGNHEASIKGADYVELKMSNPTNVFISDNFSTLNTGSPHYVQFVDDLTKIDVVRDGKKIRYSDNYKKEGINVNFVQILHSDKIKVFTYERGVEDETLACGTGVTAASIAFFLKKPILENSYNEIDIAVKGGNLKVKFNYFDGEFSNIWLCGPAKEVFEGDIIV